MSYNVGSALPLPRPPTMLNLDSSAACLFVQDGTSIMELDMHSGQLARDYFAGYGLSARGRWLMPTPASQWVELTQPLFEVEDNDGVASITVRRGCSSAGAVTVHYQTSDDSALAGVHYQVSSGDLTFDDGELSKTIEVPLIDDSAYHGDLSFSVALSNPGGATLVNPPSANVIIHETTPVADLTINGQADRNPVASGGQVTICYSLYNDGPSSANATLTSAVGRHDLRPSEISDCGGGRRRPARSLPRTRPEQARAPDRSVPRPTPAKPGRSTAPGTSSILINVQIVIVAPTARCLGRRPTYRQPDNNTPWT